MPRPVTVPIRCIPDIGTPPADFAACAARHPDMASDLEEVRVKYNPTPEQERAALKYAWAAVSNPVAELTLADLHVIATGQRSLF